MENDPERKKHKSLQGGRMNTGLPQSGNTGKCQGIFQSQEVLGNVRGNDESFRENDESVGEKSSSHIYSLSRMSLTFQTTNFA